MNAPPHRADAHRLLRRALQKRAGSGATIAASRSDAWASATFCGARHAISLRLSGGDAAARGARLTEEMDGIEFDLPGHLVADIAVRSRTEDLGGVALEIEALTVEDA